MPSKINLGAKRTEVGANGSASANLYHHSFNFFFYHAFDNGRQVGIQPDFGLTGNFF